MFDAPFSLHRVFRDPPSKMMQLRINDYTRRQGCLLSQQILNSIDPFFDDDSTEPDNDLDDE